MLAASSLYWLDKPQEQVADSAPTNGMMIPQSSFIQECLLYCVCNVHDNVMYQPHTLYYTILSTCTHMHAQHTKT